MPAEPMTMRESIIAAIEKARSDFLSEGPAASLSELWTHKATDATLALLSSPKAVERAARAMFDRQTASYGAKLDFDAEVNAVTAGWFGSLAKAALAALLAEEGT